MELSLVLLALPTLASGFTFPIRGHSSLRPVKLDGSGVSTVVASNMAMSLRDENNFEASENDTSRKSKTVDDFATKTKDWAGRYFDLFADINRELQDFDEKSSDFEVDLNERQIRRQQDFTNKAIDFAFQLGRDLADLNQSYPKFEYPQDAAQESGFEPVCEVLKDDDVCEITMELPGVTLEDVDIVIDGDALTISGQRKSLVNSQVVSFSRTFTLEPSVDPSRITAKMENGILTVMAPKDTTSSRSRRIRISKG